MVRTQCRPGKPYYRLELLPGHECDVIRDDVDSFVSFSENRDKLMTEWASSLAEAVEFEPWEEMADADLEENLGMFGLTLGERTAAKRQRLK